VENCGNYRESENWRILENMENTGKSENCENWKLVENLKIMERYKLPEKKI